MEAPPPFSLSPSLSPPVRLIFRLICACTQWHNGPSTDIPLASSFFPLHLGWEGSQL